MLVGLNDVLVIVALAIHIWTKPMFRCGRPCTTWARMGAQQNSHSTSILPVYQSSGEVEDASSKCVQGKHLVEFYLQLYTFGSTFFDPSSVATLTHANEVKSVGA
jgi:hypothetical protein